MKTTRTRTRRQKSVGEEEEEEEEETTMRVAFLLQERFKAYREMLSKSSSSKSSSVEDGEGVCGAIDAFVDEDDDDDENAKVFFFDDSFREEFRECCFSATTLTKNQTRTRRRKEEEEEEEEEEEGASSNNNNNNNNNFIKVYIRDAQSVQRHLRGTVFARGESVRSAIASERTHRDAEEDRKGGRRGGEFERGDCERAGQRRRRRRRR